MHRVQEKTQACSSRIELPLTFSKMIPPKNETFRSRRPRRLRQMTLETTSPILHSLRRGSSLRRDANDSRGNKKSSGHAKFSFLERRSGRTRGVERARSRPGERGKEESKTEERQDKADDAREKRVSALLLSSVHRKHRQERTMARVKGKDEERPRGGGRVARLARFTGLNRGLFYMLTRRKP